MAHESACAALTLAALLIATTAAQAHDDTKYPT
jgi:hypothetical protein